ncbi:WD40 repeat-like protein, partial [Gymnopus androsaceus JB14]
CLKGTRVQLLEDLHNNALGSFDPKKQIIWVHGAPGCGKSTIAKSLAERLHKENVLAASFFFSRSHESRSNSNNVFRTIAHQIAMFNLQFCNILVDVLEKDDQLGHATPGIQLKRLIIEPLSKLPKIQDPWVLVFDALDECAESTALLELLCEQIGKLPINLHIIFTSCPEHPIHMWFHNDPLKSSTHIVILDDSNGTRNGTILNFVNAPRSKSYARYGVARQACWITRIITSLPLARKNIEILPRAVLLKELASLVKRQMTRILPLARSSLSVLKNAYSSDLRGSRISLLGNSQDSLRVGVSLRGNIKAPEICKLLGYGNDDVEAMLQLMSAVLVMPGKKDDVVRIAHLSFREYATLKRTRKIANSRFKYRPELDLDASKHHECILHATFSVMKAELKFNICHLESSFLPNDQMEIFPDRIYRYIGWHLSYSCRFWSAHLNELKYVLSLSLQQCFKDFLEKRFLWWLEVISLLKQVDTAASAILSIADWSKGKNDELASTALDAVSFIRAFSSSISHSTPHIYISALSFSPLHSRIWKNFASSYPNRLSLDLGQQTSWPVIQQVLAGHTRKVLSVAISQDGKRVVSGSEDKTVRIWSAETGEEVVEPMLGHKNWVSAVAFSSDGKQVVSGSLDMTVRIWNAETGKQAVEPILGHTAKVRSVGFSSNGNRVVSGSDDDTVRIWNAETGEQVGEPMLGHTGSVTSVIFSTDGKKLVSGSWDKTIQIWNAETGEQVLGPMLGHTDSVISVGMSSDGKQVVSGSQDKTIRIWNAETGEQVGEPMLGHKYLVTSVGFSSDGKRVISGSWDKTVRIWNVETGEQGVEPILGHTDLVTSVGFSSDGKRAVSGSWDNTVRIWNAETGEKTVEQKSGYTSSVTSVGFSSDGKRVVSGSHDNAIQIWNAETGEQVLEPILGHTDSVRSVGFSSDGKSVVSGSWDNTIRIWSAETGEQVVKPMLGHKYLVASVRFSSDGKRIVSGSHDNTIRIWNAETGEQVVKPILGHGEYNVTCVGFSPDGKRVVSGSEDTTIRVWNAETGEQVMKPIMGHTSWVTSVGFSSNGRKLVSGSWDKTVRIWNAETGESVVEPILGHTDLVTSVGFSPNGKRVVSGSKDKTVRIWNAHTGEQLAKPMLGHTDSVTSVQFSSDGRRIASGSLDKTIRIWNIGQPDPFATTNGWVHGKNSELLFWVPPQCCVALWRPNNTLVIGENPTKLNFNKFVFGRNWQACYSPDTLAA